jgi:iron complex outermembrane recepter protein
MRVDEDRAILARVLSPFAIVFASLCLLAAPTVFAQDDGEDDQAELEDDRAVDEVTVTGSRLKRDTYSSISPLQIITAQVSREVGLIDAADILQESSAASGAQIDLSFQGFVLDNGPGSSTLSLRGLGEARTLVLVNGRRLAPGGVEGAPFAANLNQIPASLVQQYDLLLDGASSVYGSDAIAGVANVILRSDFDGFEVEGYTRVPEYSGGIENTLSIIWGKNFDRGFIGLGAEFQDTDSIARKERPWTAGCARNVEIDETGQFRSQERFYTDVYGMEWDDCRLGSLAGRVLVPFAGSIYYTPGYSNGGWGNFSESSTYGFGVDGDGDGNTDISFRDYDLNGKPSEQDSDLLNATETAQFMAYGEYTLNGEANITPYFEVLYSDFSFSSRSAQGQLFPFVPALNPYNLCNPAAITGDGVDCGTAQDALYTNPNYQVQFGQRWESLCAQFGIPLAGCTPAVFGLLTGPIGADGSQPVVSVTGDRNTTAVSSEQLRVVGGVRGDLPWLTMGSLDNWSFDIYASYSDSSGTSARPGVRADRLELSLGWYSLTNTPCEANDPNATGPRSGLTVAELGADVGPGCLPVNMFAPSLYPVGVVTGDFATQAERDYLFDSRDFKTGYEQSVISAYVTGEIFETAAGSVALGIGIETRNDDIASVPDAVARDGLLWGFFSDGGATGDKNTDEIFAEIEIPLLAGVPGAEELTLNMSTRYTDDEIYGSGNTESIKLGWRPVESLLIRGTFGTSFRAPNLRELFLASQSGFSTLFDPCFIPDAAINPITGGYDPSLDDREATVLANCRANGVDPTLADNAGFNNFSTEVARGGALDLNAEESESWSAGISWDQPFTNAFGLVLSATYYEIEVNQTIIEPSGQFIINDCYNSVTGNSVFCSRINRDLSDPTFPRFDIIDSGFINRESEAARGVDVNLTLNDSFTIFDRPIDLAWDVTANRMLERSTLFIDDDGNQDIDTFQGEFGYPDWNVRSGLRFDYDNWRFTWETRYLSSVNQDPRGVDAFSQAITGSADTCIGPPTDVLCRDYGEADNYFLHHSSVYYYGDRWTVGGGIRNVFNQEPPVVDSTEVGSINNTPRGVGYDLMGRTYFLNVAVNFGGGE